MKNIILFFCSLIISSISFAESPIIVEGRSCTTQVPSFDDPTNTTKMEFDITAVDAYKLSAKVIVDGAVMSEDAEVSMSIDVIREGLKPLASPDATEEVDISDYNWGEKMIAHAMSLTSDSTFAGLFSTGIEDLSKVRAVTTYTVGKVEEDSIGNTSIVVARDDQGNELGSFFGGFFVTPCE